LVNKQTATTLQSVVPTNFSIEHYISRIYASGKFENINITVAPNKAYCVDFEGKKILVLQTKDNLLIQISMNNSTKEELINVTRQLK